VFIDQQLFECSTEPWGSDKLPWYGKWIFAHVFDINIFPDISDQRVVIIFVLATDDHHVQACVCLQEAELVGVGDKFFERLDWDFICDFD
jgi:hypothetical protein